MLFSYKETLTRLTSSDTVCPICRGDGLIIRTRDMRTVLPDLRGIPTCTCQSCGFNGEFPELVATATDKGIEETVRELHRLNELAATNRDIDTYIKRKTVQAEISAYFDKCVDRLRDAPHVCNIRAGLSISNLRQLPPDTGLYISDGAPSAFALLSAPRYTRVPMTLYRYTFDGETACIDAQNPKTLQREHRLRVCGSVGVYLGHYGVGDAPSVIVGTHNPRTAGQIYGALRAESSLPPPVIGIAGFPLPQKFETISTLYLLDTADSPLPLEFAIHAISTPIIYGRDADPVVKVLSTRCCASDVTSADIRALSNSYSHGTPIRKWIVSRILEKADSPEEIANALLQAGASENVRAELVELLGEASPQSLRDIVMLPTTEPDDVFTLGSGKMVKNTPVGMYTANRQKKTNEIVSKSLLCNVGITVDARVVDRGLETACCTITHPDADVPQLSVRIPRTHWNNPDALAEDIRTAYAEIGRTPYIAFYRVGGYGWCDIMQFIGARCPVQTGLKALGVTSTGESNFPNVTVSRKIVSKQTKAGLILPHILAAYSAIDNKAENDVTCTFKSFLASTASLCSTGVAAGMLQVLYCASGTMFDQSGVRRPPSHLLFVETEPGVWDSTIRTLAYIFSGSEYVPIMDYGNMSGFLDSWAQLGTLPLITRIPSSDSIAATLASSPVSVIAVTDPLTALSCSGRGPISFVLPHVESLNSSEITPETITDLRIAFLSLIAEHVGTGWVDIGTGGATAMATPCLSTLGALTSDKSNDTVAGGLYRSVKGRYPGIGMTGAKAFFGVLHRIYTTQATCAQTDLHLTVVTGAPADTVSASFNERGEHVFILPGSVIVSRSVVQLINKEKSFLFDTEQLSHEFEENGILLHGTPDSKGIDPSRIWVFSREVWDSEVVRASGFQYERKKYERYR